MSLDVMHLLYIIEFATWGNVTDATTGHT